MTSFHTLQLFTLKYTRTHTRRINIDNFILQNLWSDANNFIFFFFKKKSIIILSILIIYIYKDNAVDFKFLKYMDIFIIILRSKNIRRINSKSIILPNLNNFIHINELN